MIQLLPVAEPLEAIAFSAYLRHRVATQDFFGRNRSTAASRARWDYYAEARAQGYTLKAIGALVNRGHDTVIHGLRERERLLWASH